jgi:hypothetical protein
MGSEDSGLTLCARIRHIHITCAECGTHTGRKGFGSLTTITRFRTVLSQYDPPTHGQSVEQACCRYLHVFQGEYCAPFAGT